jgi:hypothetical protein
MGGQACILYGAAEFSRDTDILLLAEPANMQRLAAALKELQAVCIAVPPLSLRYLKKGHAAHFRCLRPDVKGIRIDILSVLRGVPSFATLWKRRTTVTVARGEQYDLMALPDLVRAKKTQRDKDWPMLRRLLEANYAQNKSRPTRRHVEFWLREMRTPSLLSELAQSFPRETERAARRRPLLSLAATRRMPALEQALADEERREREQDRAYWVPLKRELERLRHRRS